MVAHAGVCRAAAAAAGEGKHKHRKVSDDCRCLRQEGGERERETERLDTDTAGETEAWRSAWEAVRCFTSIKMDSESNESGRRQFLHF